ncbi:unnamed protein product [Symbiodinium natans]|uniref:Uncharacterized protein n=1 Tax=Symbiodinium natans TaxID=878477 RepID=A0A812JD75_9DINO|nr:unnamed protein product [Symbiodinium natans]
MKLRPEEIFFSHDSISCRFSCGRFIEDTYQQLRDGDIHVSIIPRMTVCEVDGEWFAFNGNRRLWVFKKLALEGILQEVQVYVTDRSIPRRRFTTDTEGRRIEVRHRSDLDFPPPGPRICARFQNEATQQSFMDSATAGAISSVALSYEGSGYFLCKTGGGWKYRGMSTEVGTAVSEKKDSTAPTCVALGDDDRFFVKLDDGSMTWKACQAFSKAVKKASKERLTVEAVAFAPHGGWWMRTSDGASQWDDLPETLQERLQEEDGSAMYVSVSKAGDAWFVEFPGYRTWQGVDDSCTKAIDEHGRRISRIVFGDCDFGGCDDIVLEFY